MDVTVDHGETAVVVTPKGDVDASSAPQLRATLDDLLVQGVHNFVIDLSSVEFLDSSGIATLVQLFKRVRIGEGDVRVCGLQAKVQRVFALIRLDRVFDTFEGRAEALASFGGAEAR